MFERLLPLAIIIALLAACSPRPVFDKPGGTQVGFDRDNYACLSAHTYYGGGYAPAPVYGGGASAEGGFARGLTSTLRIPPGPRVDRGGYMACMRARGWREE